MEYVRDLIIVCAVGAVAAAFAPSRFGRGVKTLSVILVALTAVSPLAGLLSHANDVLGIETEPESVCAQSYDGAVLEQTAEVIASYVRGTLSDKYGVGKDVRISVLFDGGPDSVKLTGIQIFSGVRFDSYRDREIEDDLSRSLGCDVFIYSE